MKSTPNQSINACQKLLDEANRLQLNASIIDRSKPSTRRHSPMGSTAAPQKVMLIDGIRMSLAQARQYVAARQKPIKDEDIYTSSCHEPDCDCRRDIAWPDNMNACQQLKPIIVENKATMNRGNIRAWRQVKNCPHQTANRRYDIEYNSANAYIGGPSVRIEWNENGAKKVSDTARGATIDLVNKSMTELFGTDWMDEKFHNFVWKIDETGITITAKYLGDS